MQRPQVREENREDELPDDLRGGGHILGSPAVEEGRVKGKRSVQEVAGLDGLQQEVHQVGLHRLDG
jgi:hypothetical protein